MKVLCSSEKTLLKQNYLTLNGIQTHETLSCTEQQTVTVLFKVEKDLASAKCPTLNGIQTHETLSCTG